MNEVVMFDTHEAFKNFEKAGVAKEHAEVFVEELSKVVVSRSDELATKGELQAGLAEVNAKIEVVGANLLSKTVIWLGFFATLILAAIGGAVGILLKMLGQ